jgi:hypothetical protein
LDFTFRFPDITNKTNQTNSANQLICHLDFEFLALTFEMLPPASNHFPTATPENRNSLKAHFSVGSEISLIFFGDIFNVVFQR